MTCDERRARSLRNDADRLAFEGDHGTAAFFESVAEAYQARAEGRAKSHHLRLIRLFEEA